MGWRERRFGQVKIAGFASSGEARTTHLWAFGQFEKFIDRAHQLKLPRPVPIWFYICDGSIDHKLKARLLKNARQSINWRTFAVHVKWEFLDF